jgi:hypothetical protein
MKDPHKLAVIFGSANMLALVLAIVSPGYMTLAFLAISVLEICFLRLLRPPANIAAKNPQLAPQPQPDRFQVQAEANARLRVRDHQIYLRILSSGDSLYEEHFRDVEPYRETQISEIRGFLESEYGYFKLPVYTPKSIVWEWEKQEGDRRYAVITFNPPLQKGVLRTYSRELLTFNSVYFNQQDRRDSLWNKNKDVTREEVWFDIRNAYNDFFVQVAFPADHFPQRWYVEAVDTDTLQEDQSESARAEKALTVLSNAGILQLRIHGPLCGLRYRLSWDLPKTEADEVHFTADQQASREDAAERLSIATDAVLQVSNELREMLRGRYADKLVNLVLYAYRREKERGGLWPVADADSLLDASAGSNAVVRLGRTLPGQCYRRRSEILFSRFHQDDETGYEALPAFQGQHPVFAIAVPISFPEPRGLRLGVVYVQSHALNSGLNALVDDVDAKTDFVKMVRRWHVQRLMPAIYPEFSGREPDALPWL